MNFMGHPADLEHKSGGGCGSSGEKQAVSDKRKELNFSQGTSSQSRAGCHCGVSHERFQLGLLCERPSCRPHLREEHWEIPLPRGFRDQVQGFSSTYMFLAPAPAKPSSVCDP